MNKLEKLGIGIINTNQRSGVLRLLESIEADSVTGVEVFLLDNNCVLDQRLKKDLRLFKVPIYYTQKDETLQWAAAVNVLGRQMKIGGCDWFWFVDGQMMIKPGTMDLIRSVAKNKSIVRSSMIESSDGVGRCTGGKFGFEVLNKKWLQSEKGSNKFEREPDWISGENMLISQEMFGQLGGFNVRLYRGLVDVEMCLRAKKAGYGLKLERKMWVKQERKGTEKQRLDDYFYARNYVLLVKKYMSWYGKAFCLLEMSLRLFMQRLGGREKIDWGLTWGGMRDGWKLNFEEDEN